MAFDGQYKYLDYAGLKKFASIIDDKFTDANSKFLPLTGGTLTGALTINGSNADTANLHFARTSYNYISSPADSAIHMCPSGIAKSSTTGYVFNSSEFHPGTTEAYSLGSLSKRWNNVYASTFNGGGLVLGGSDTDRNILRVSCTTGETVNSTSNYGYTLKFLGSGTGVNNALALYADNSTATTQNLATKWLNDGTMYGRSILPHTTNTFDLGSSSLKWKNIYATTFTGNLTGNATSATKLTSDAGSYVHPIYFSGGKPVKISSLNDRHIVRISPNDNGSIKNISIIDKSASYLHSANRLQFANPNGIIVEYSTDGGTTWIDYELTDSEKIALVSGNSAEIYAGKKLSSVATTNDQLRITIVANLCGFYTSADALLINFSVNGSTNCRVNVERAYRGSETEFTMWKTGLEVSGWSGWNSLPLGFSFGGGSTQTANVGAIRLTFYSDGAMESYTSGAHFNVQDLQLLGSTYWLHPSNMAKTGHLYNWDVSQNMIIPASILPKQSHTTNTIGSNIGAPGLQFNTVYSRYIDTVEAYNLRLKSGGVEHINMINGNVNATANIIPTATETYNLGTSSYYWKNVYAKTLHENGESLTNKYAHKDHTHDSISNETIETLASTYLILEETSNLDETI